MLNLNRHEQALTQGQPLGKRVLARSVQIDEITVEPQGQPNPAQAGQPGSAGSGASSAGAQVSPQAVADRVYELMRRDLVVERERRG